MRIVCDRIVHFQIVVFISHFKLSIIFSTEKLNFTSRYRISDFF